MDSEELKKIITNRIKQQGVYLSDEQLNEYTQCLLSKRYTNNLISIAAGMVAFATIPVKASTPLNYYLKKSLYSTGILGAVSMFTQMGTIMSCAPILQKSLGSKMNNPQQGATHETIGENDEPSTNEPLDFTSSISSSDFSSPLNFSSDSHGLDRPEDSQEARDKVGSGKKRVTYDDLWRQHKDTSQSRAGPKPYRSEGADAGSTVESGEPSWEKRKIRTNKYGDPLE